MWHLAVCVVSEDDGEACALWGGVVRAAGHGSLAAVVLNGDWAEIWDVEG